MRRATPAAFLPPRVYPRPLATQQKPHLQQSRRDSTSAFRSLATICAAVFVFFINLPSAYLQRDRYSEILSGPRQQADRAQGVCTVENSG